MGLCLLLSACGSSAYSALSPTGSSPLVIAHRGASHEAPENTIAAYALAIEQGARLAECDVYLSSDGVPVVFHDAELERTTNGKGAIESKTLAELKELDAGSWKNSRYAGERIPTLVEFLCAVKDRLRPVIEIKGSGRGIEAAVIAALREAEFASEDVMIFSFRLETVAEIARLDPYLPTTWLVGDPPADPAPLRAVLREALAARVSALGVSRGDLHSTFLRRAHESGFPVFVWTVNDRDDMVQLAGQGVDAIITDRPDLALRIFGGEKE